MSENNRGFTLIELMIVIALLSVSFDILFGFFPIMKSLAAREKKTEGLCRASRIAAALDHLSHVSSGALVEADPSGRPRVSAVGRDGSKWSLAVQDDGRHLSLTGAGRFDILVSGAMACAQVGNSILVDLDLTEPGIPKGEGAFAFVLESTLEGGR